MKMRFLLLLFIIILAAPLAQAAEKPVDAATFHPPQTEAEKALEVALHHSNDKSAMTPALLNVITKAQEKKNNGSCTKHLENRGELCEMAADTLTCGAVFHDTYVYRTTYAGNEKSTIDAIWPDFVNSSAPEWHTYRMIRSNGIWLLDGIDCGGLYKFNISTKPFLDRFHLATSDPEKVLDRIFSLNKDKDADLYDFVFNYPQRNSNKDDEFSTLFSRAFLERSEKEEKFLIKESCGGKYPAISLPCDMIRNINPIYCAQDSPDVFFYRTITLDGEKAVVTYTWPHIMQDGPVYSLVRNKGRWVLDGIDCGFVQKPSLQ